MRAWASQLNLCSNEPAKQRASFTKRPGHLVAAATEAEKQAVRDSPVGQLRELH